MSDLTFEAFPKIGRLKRECVVTEKVDGTNAQIVFGDSADDLLVGSRKRQIWPEGTPGKDKGCDNFGFAGWVYENREALFAFLGTGRHYGEWAGKGIQRTYGLDEKRFFLFNTARFGPGRQEVPPELKAIGLDVVPVLYIGEFDTRDLDQIMVCLADEGSAIEGASKDVDPEGIVVYQAAVRQLFKVTYDYDDGKWRHNVA